MTRKHEASSFSVSVLILSIFWSCLSALARVFTRWGLLKSTRLPCRVISVGNIQAGGAGKTPLVAVIAQEAASLGLNVCILCRGYGGEWEHNGGVIPPKGYTQDPEPGANITGDEAALLHELAPMVWIAVGANRILQFQRAQAQGKKPFDLVILDDGFQHWKLKRDIDVLAMTSYRPWNILFRDFRWAAKAADLIVWTKGDYPPFPYGKAWLRVEYQLSKGSGNCWLVTGVADGAFVKKTAIQAGYEIKNHLIFPDHAHYENNLVHKILDDAKAAGCKVATTGKDWVKWKRFGISRSDVIVLEPKVSFSQGKEHWDRTLWKS